MQLARELETLAAVLRRDDVEAFAREEAAHEIAHRLLVVDHQDLAAAGAHHLRHRREAGMAWRGWVDRRGGRLDRLQAAARQAGCKGAADARRALDRDVAAHQAAKAPA